ncbi:protein delta homolog 2 [Ambystoma mexicanum]|uniref:protein delta homolog 2 n=1 Tax=Ambystoma mexicanum TaxID=8296 RepID=UPI0037E91D25
MHRGSCLQIVSLICILLSRRLSAQADACSALCDLAHGRCDEDDKCRCDPGWEGEYCEKCVRMPGCLHGTCHQPWQCMCLPGWAGKFCERDVHICIHQNPCRNEAECVDDPEGEYSCVCPEGFHGKNCELKMGPCERAGSPCKNGGSCQDNHGYATNFTCRCLAGYVGDLCELDVDDCLMRPCANGATCHDGINRFSCECQVGFEGRFCTVNIDDCVSGPCQNGGKCYDRVSDYDCICTNGFTGKTCDVSPGLVPKPTRITLNRPASKDNPNFTPMRGTTSDYPRITWPQPIRTVDTDSWSSNASEKPNGGLLKISVKEVVTQRDPGLTEVQILTLVVFGGLTAVLVMLTIALVLWKKRRVRHRLTWCQSSSDRNRKAHDEECQVHMLNIAAIELRKTTEL